MGRHASVAPRRLERCGCVVSGGSPVCPPRRKMSPAIHASMVGGATLVLVILAGFILARHPNSAPARTQAMYSGTAAWWLFSMAMVAGAESVVTSLWKVDDDATRDLMTRFYGSLREGTGRAEALRRAALEVRKTRAHPYYWAPFVAIGHPGPVDALKGTR